MLLGSSLPGLNYATPLRKEVVLDPPSSQPLREVFAKRSTEKGLILTGVKRCTSITIEAATDTFVISISSLTLRVIQDKDLSMRKAKFHRILWVFQELNIPHTSRKRGVPDLLIEREEDLNHR